MTRVLIVDDHATIPQAAWDALSESGIIVDYKTKEDETMFNRRNVLVAALAGFAGALTSGAEKLTQLAVANDNFRQSFSARYGNNPRSLNGNSARNSKAAQQKRAARKRRDIRARASKRA